MRILGALLVLTGALGLAFAGLVFWAMAGHFDYGFLGFAGLAKALGFVAASTAALVAGLILLMSRRRTPRP